MGVLNVQEKLRHRARAAENDPQDNNAWEEQFFHAAPPSAVTQPLPVRSRSRKCKPQNTTVDHVRKGSRQKRRLENTCFLLSLVDHEELTDLEVSNFVNTTMSMFATLFGDNEKMEIWNEFVSLPEEEQESILKNKSQKEKVPGAEEETSDSPVTTAEDRHLKEAEMVASAGRSFNRIDKRIRRAMRSKRFPMGSLKKFEDEMVSCFSDIPDVVWVSILPSSFDRLVMHGICQYLRLLSTTVNFRGVQYVEVEDKRNAFTPPYMLLSQYLERHR